MSKLAGLLGVRPQTVTPIVDTLERAGWVRRVRSTEDRRESLLTLTPKGKRLLESVRTSFFEKLGRALDEAPSQYLGTATEVLLIASSALVRDLSRARNSLAAAKRGGRLRKGGVR
ncbi:MAG: MarR family transcriptional regulator, partial [Thermoplasmata archaeon]|nr:MarR family transcriptional regulator [Thermoplasmata archaeon]